MPPHGVAREISRPACLCCFSTLAEEEKEAEEVVVGVEAERVSRRRG